MLLWRKIEFDHATPTRNVLDYAIVLGDILNHLDKPLPNTYTLVCANNLKKMSFRLSLVCEGFFKVFCTDKLHINLFQFFTIIDKSSQLKSLFKLIL